MNLNKKRVILTGGAGFIGNNFGRLLMNKYIDDLLVIDKMDFMSNKKVYLDYNVPVMETDLRSEDILKWVPHFKPDIIIHMAAESHVDRSIKDPRGFVDNNVMGTMNLLNACLRMETLPHFVHISTDEVYGDIDNGESVEDDLLNPSSPYSASKAAADLLVMSYHRTYGIPYLITRSSNNYGIFQHTEKFIPTVISRIKQQQYIPVYGNGLQERNWIHVIDNCRGIFAAIEHMNNNIFNIGGKYNYNNLEIINMITTIMEVDPKKYISFVQDRPGHDKRYALSSIKLMNASGWEPQINMEYGLKSLIDVYK